MQDSIGTLKAHISGSKIFLKWNWSNSTISPFVENIIIYYSVEGSSKMEIFKQLDKSYKTAYVMSDIDLDAKYKICLRVIMSVDWPGVREPDRICANASDKWELSAFFGSTAGALIALILIILLILFSKRAKKRQKARNTDTNDKPRRLRFDSAFESQFDSVAIREDTSFYDEYIISDISFYDSSIRSHSDTNISHNANTPTVIIGENISLKGLKRKTSLIEEESTGGQSYDSVPAPVIFRDKDLTYQNHCETPERVNKLSNLPIENKNNIIETCIDEVKDRDDY